MSIDRIIIRGAREHNLKGIDLDLPRDRLVVITGLSGSGKSSLAFNTIYAEGQRRYVESLSVYARQFLEQMSRPEVDTIEGLSPAISIEQRGLSRNPRSTVGTVTEIYDYLRLLFARAGTAHCYGCGRELRAQSVQEMVDQVYELPARARVSVLAPVVRDRKGGFQSLLDQLRRDGYTRARIDGELQDLGDPIALAAGQRHQIDVYVDRLVLKPEARSRLADSLELALKLGSGVVTIATPDAGGVEGQEITLSELSTCHACGIHYPEITPRLFSFNSPFGACPRCSGLGVLLELDESLIVPDASLSLREGAIEPWDQRGAAYFQQLLERLAEREGFSMVTPFGELPELVRRLILHGSPDTSRAKGGSGRTSASADTSGATGRFEGVVPNLERRLIEQQRRLKDASSGQDLEAFDDVLEELNRYMRSRPCPECEGTRLRREARHVLLDGRPITEVSRMSVATAHQYFSQIELSGARREIARKVIDQISSRLAFLAGVGLQYLTLDRSASTLSGGEGQRVRLATQIGSSLVGVLYILDEPSIGLHQRDNERLLQTLQRLRDGGNTVLVVEHDEQIVRAADYVVDLGPGAGTRGGRVVAAGSVPELMAAPESITGQFLSGKRRIEVSPRRRRPEAGQLVVRGAQHNNLKNLDVALPLEVFVCVTGVSGSGKSSLIVDTLLPALRVALHGAKDPVGSHAAIENLHRLDKVIAIDQSPIGRTPRSNPATYTGVFGAIRDLFAGLPEARVRGYKAGRFSFNVKGGRCEACRGDGVIRIEMHFLPDVYVACEVCGGRRYNEETLRIAYKGKSIADVLEMTIDDAHDFLAAVPRLRDKLATLREVGLGYLQLGQPANTLSGGEAQRVKLSRELSRRASGRTLYVLDEPTTGLHSADIELLLQVLSRLVDAGNSVVVIEHHLDVIKCADYVIDLGPEGGDDGGRLVAAGTPEVVADCPASHTGRYLRRALGIRSIER